MHSYDNTHSSELRGFALPCVRVCISQRGAARDSTVARDMSSTTFYVLLAAGGLVIAPLAWLIRSAHKRGSLFGTAFSAVIVAVIAGTFASEFFDAPNLTGLLAALGVTLLYTVFVNPSGDGSLRRRDGGGCGGCGGD